MSSNFVDIGVYNIKYNIKMITFGTVTISLSDTEPSSESVKDIAKAIAQVCDQKGADPSDCRFLLGYIQTIIQGLKRFNQTHHEICVVGSIHGWIVLRRVPSVEFT